MNGKTKNRKRQKTQIGATKDAKTKHDSHNIRKQKTTKRQT